MGSAFNMKIKNPKCPECQKNPALIHKIYGILVCHSCQDNTLIVSKNHEFTSSSIKQQRVEYGRQMVQPWHEGYLSKEYVEAYGTAKLEGVTKQDVKQARYTYKDMARHHKIIEGKK